MGAIISQDRAPFPPLLVSMTAASAERILTAMVSWFTPAPSGLCGTPCDGCCPSPTLLAETVSASLSKCGFPEFTGYVSTPPKYYLQSAYSHTGSASWNGGGTPANHSNSSVDFTSTTLTTAPACTSVTTPSGTSSSTLVQDGDTQTCGPVDDESCWAVWDACGTICPGGSGADCTPVVTTSATEESSTVATSGSGTFGSTCSYSETITTILSSEYTTAALIGYADAALPAYTGTFPSSSPSAAYDLSANQTTVSLSQAEYKFRFPATACYQINWVERFIGVDDDGDPLPPVDTAMSWTYTGGATPPGYNPADETTWPESPVYNLPVPSSNGETTVVNVTAACTCGS